MWTPTRYQLLTLLAITVAMGSSCSSRSGDGTIEWLRGSGDGLQMRVQGKVIQSEGDPASDYQITAVVHDGWVRRPMALDQDGHRFEFWLPVNQLAQATLILTANSTSDDRVAYSVLPPFTWRQAAIDGVTMTLQSPARQIAVHVTDEGQPVTDASVKAVLEPAIELRERTNADGIAHFQLLPGQQVEHLTAWADDFRVGGYSFERSPKRNRDSDEYDVELSRCRDQPIRFIDQDGRPVPNLEFEIQVATAAPDLNYIGRHDHNSLRCDEKGEAIYPWFPDWDQHFSYVHLLSREWVIDGVPYFKADAPVFKLQPSKFADRKTIRGKIESSSADGAGMYVEMWSFQGEGEDQGDRLSAFSDGTGSFAVDVLPDATYCAHVIDTRWVSNIVDWGPYRAAEKTTLSPKLSIRIGQPVEVFVTAGPTNTPIVNLPVSFHRDHSFQWWERGEEQSGTAGPQWWTMTDESGRATTRTLPGQLEVSVSSADWGTRQTVEVSDGEPAIVRMHRSIEEPRTITGRLILPEGMEDDLEDATIKIRSVDGQYFEAHSLTCDRDGQFSLPCQSTQLGLFASTRRGGAAGAIVVADVESPVELPLLPTATLQGQLLRQDGLPAVGHEVCAFARIEGDRRGDAIFPPSFEGFRTRSVTDEHGRYTLHGVPSRMRVRLATDPTDGSGKKVDIGWVFLQPGESRVLEVARLGNSPIDHPVASLEAQYSLLLRDAALNGCHVMLIVRNRSNQTAEFEQRHLLDPDSNHAVRFYMPMVIVANDAVTAAESTAFLRARSLPVPHDGQIIACALDTNEVELGRLDIDVADESAAEGAVNFVRRYVPPRVDADERWKDAFAEAKRTNRRVWARVTQRYCGPCILFARWLDDQRPILENDYVLLKIDDVRDKNGVDVAQRVRDEWVLHGVPFHAIFDENGSMLVDSIGPAGNIGHPGHHEGRQHLRKMLEQSRQRLSDSELDQLLESLTE